VDEEDDEDEEDEDAVDDDVFPEEEPPPDEDDEEDEEDDDESPLLLPPPVRRGQPATIPATTTNTSTCFCMGPSGDNIDVAEDTTHFPVVQASLACARGHAGGTGGERRRGSSMPVRALYAAHDG
jgi:hypothetical protein